MEMGFIRTDVVKALDACGGESESALDYLLAVVCRDEPAEPAPEPASAFEPPTTSGGAPALPSTLPPPLLADDLAGVDELDQTEIGVGVGDLDAFANLGLSIQPETTVAPTASKGAPSERRRRGRGGKSTSSTRPVVSTTASLAPQSTIPPPAVAAPPPGASEYLILKNLSSNCDIASLQAFVAGCGTVRRAPAACVQCFLVAVGRD